MDEMADCPISQMADNTSSGKKNNEHELLSELVPSRQPQSIGGSNGGHGYVPHTDQMITDQYELNKDTASTSGKKGDMENEFRQIDQGINVRQIDEVSDTLTVKQGQIEEEFISEQGRWSDSIDDSKSDEAIIDTKSIYGENNEVNDELIKNLDGSESHVPNVHTPVETKYLEIQVQVTHDDEKREFQMKLDDEKMKPNKNGSDQPKDQSAYMVPQYGTGDKENSISRFSDLDNEPAHNVQYLSNGSRTDSPKDQSKSPENIVDSKSLDVVDHQPGNDFILSQDGSVSHVADTPTMTKTSELISQAQVHFNFNKDEFKLKGHVEQTKSTNDMTNQYESRRGDKDMQNETLDCEDFISRDNDSENECLLSNDQYPRKQVGTELKSIYVSKKPSVLQILQHIKLEQYNETFEKKFIDYEVLVQLKEDDLLELDIKIGPRITIFQEIRKISIGKGCKVLPTPEQSMPDILKSLNLDKVISQFEAQLIDSTAFLGLKDKHFDEMQLPIGAKIKIRNKIKELKSSNGKVINNSKRARKAILGTLMVYMVFSVLIPSFDVGTDNVFVYSNLRDLYYTSDDVNLSNWRSTQEIFIYSCAKQKDITCHESPACDCVDLKWTRINKKDKYGKDYYYYEYVCHKREDTFEYKKQDCEYFSILLHSMLVPILLNITFTALYWLEDIKKDRSMKWLSDVWDVNTATIRNWTFLKITVRKEQILRCSVLLFEGILLIFGLYPPYRCILYIITALKYPEGDLWRKMKDEYDRGCALLEPWLESTLQVVIMTQIMLIPAGDFIGWTEYKFFSINMFRTTIFNWVSWIVSIVAMVIGLTKFFLIREFRSNKPAVMGFVINMAFVVRVSLSMVLAGQAPYIDNTRLSIPLIIAFGLPPFLINLGNLLVKAGFTRTLSEIKRYPQILMSPIFTPFLFTFKNSGSRKEFFKNIKGKMANCCCLCLEYPNQQYLCPLSRASTNNDNGMLLGQDV